MESRGLESDSRRPAGIGEAWRAPGDDAYRTERQSPIGWEPLGRDSTRKERIEGERNGSRRLERRGSKGMPNGEAVVARRGVEWCGDERCRMERQADGSDRLECDRTSMGGSAGRRNRSYEERIGRLYERIGLESNGRDHEGAGEAGNTTGVDRMGDEAMGVERQARDRSGPPRNGPEWQASRRDRLRA